MADGSESPDRVTISENDPPPSPITVNPIYKELSTDREDKELQEDKGECTSNDLS